MKNKLMKNFYHYCFAVFCFLILIKSQTYSQNFAFMGTGDNDIGSPSQTTSQGNDITVDPNGNVYVLVSFENGVLDVNPDPAAQFTLDGNLGLNDQNMAVVKYGSSGNFIWAKHFFNSNPNGNELSFSGIAYNSIDNSIAIVGSFNGSCDFDPGVGQFVVNSQTFIEDALVLKLTSNGDFVWVKTFGQPAGGARAYDVAVDGDSNILLTGIAQDTGNTNTDFDPGAGVLNIDVKDSSAYVLKLTKDGNFVWAKAFVPNLGSQSSAGYSIAVDSQNNVFTTGAFRNSVDFDPNVGVVALVSAGSSDTFISKLNSAGDYVWAHKLGANQEDEGRCIAIDKTQNVIIGGYYRSPMLDVDPTAGVKNLTNQGDADIFLCKLSNGGSFIWGNGFGGSKRDEIYDIGVDLSGSSNSDIYFTGPFASDTIDFDPSAKEWILKDEVDVGFGEGYICKVNASGTLLHARQIGGDGEHYSGAIAISTSRNVYTTGKGINVTDFDTGPGLFNINSEKSHYYVSRLDYRLRYRNSTGAFDADDNDDILFQNPATGVNQIWSMNKWTKGVTSQITQNGLVPDPAFKIKATGDFNHDGITDVVVQNEAVGSCFIWIMAAKTGVQNPISFSVVVNAIVGAWVPVAGNDFNQDGNDDILCQNKATGESMLVFMNGTQVNNTVVTPAVGLAWEIRGTGWFDGSSGYGHPDILWQNTQTGERVIALMNGGQITQFVSLGIAGNWRLGGAANLEADLPYPRSTILQDDKVAGKRVAWFMNETVDAPTVKVPAALPDNATLSINFEIRNR